jgi:hypothetical protein
MTGTSPKYSDVSQVEDKKQTSITILVDRAPDDDADQAQMLHSLAYKLEEEIRTKRAALSDVMMAIRYDADRVMDRATYDARRIRGDRFRTRMTVLGGFVFLVGFIIFIALEISQCPKSSH